MDSDFSLLKQNQQKDVMDFNALFVEQDHGAGEFTPHLTSWIYHMIKICKSGGWGEQCKLY